MKKKNKRKLKLTITKRLRCPISGCRCFESTPFSYNRIGPIIIPEPILSEKEQQEKTKELKKHQRKIDKIREKRKRRVTK